MLGERERGGRTVRGDVPEQLLGGRDEQAVLGEVGGDGVQREEGEAHREGYGFHEEPHGDCGCKEGEGGEEDEDAGGAVGDAPFVEALAWSARGVVGGRMGEDVLAQALEEIA